MPEADANVTENSNVVPFPMRSSPDDTRWERRIGVVFDCGDDPHELMRFMLETIVVIDHERRGLLPRLPDDVYLDLMASTKLAWRRCAALISQPPTAVAACI